MSKAFGVGIALTDWRRAYRVRGETPSNALDLALRSLRQLLREQAQGQPVRVYVGLAAGPPEAITPGKISRGLYHAREGSVEVHADLNTSTEDEAVGPALGALVIEAIEFGARELTDAGLEADPSDVVAQIQQWVAKRRPLSYAESTAQEVVTPPGRIKPTAMPSPQVQDSLEIHVPLPPEPKRAGILRQRLQSFEDAIDSLLGGRGYMEGNEIGADEWVIFVLCDGADEALEALRPQLQQLEAKGTFCRTCTRTEI